MRENLKHFVKKRRLLLASVATLAIVFYFSLPSPLFTTPYSDVVYDKNGELLGARTAADGQWRFPLSDSVPERFAKALMTYEDKRFYNHIGVDPLAMARAIKLNLKHGRVVSGGSTLTMQVIRLSRKGESRTVFEKLIEVYLAIRLELSYSKNEILNAYASHAPFGGNVVGLDAAAWRYFGRRADHLSWAESAMLAVLPNNPSMVHPGKNRDALKKKRNFLLQKLYKAEVIDKTNYELALLEELPHRPYPLPNTAPHLTERIRKSKKLRKQLATHRYQTTLKIDLQRSLNDIVDRHQRLLSRNEIHNIGAVIIEVQTGNVLAYAGNSSKAQFGRHNDMIMAERSPGSLLKPLLYADMLQSGELLPNQMVTDIPINIGGYAPQNFNLEYDGAIKASQAISRSLNVPAVLMLQQQGVERFYDKLKKLGSTTLHHSPSHYGLSLILGGGENTLWELTGIYASMARMLNYHNQESSYSRELFHAPRLFEEEQNFKKQESFYLMDAASAWHMFNAMTEVIRPEEDTYWQHFSSLQRVAWKTGTSFGYRNGWAIGVNPRYVVGVWAGNANGEGRPGLTGVSAAAPVLFDIFRELPRVKWFDEPLHDMENIEVCTKSGYRASPICNEVERQWVPKATLRGKVCPYHQLAHLDKTGNYRVTGNCESMADIKQVSWFVLPPSQEYYYKNKDPGYKLLPPMRADCFQGAPERAMEIIYPKNSKRIKIPKEIDGQLGKAVFEVAHRKLSATIYWHLDEQYIGSTREFHQMALQPKPGNHVLTLVDEDGYRIRQEILFVR